MPFKYAKKKNYNNFGRKMKYKKPNTNYVRNVVKKELAKTVELKVIDNTIGSNMNSGGAIQYLNGCNQGDGMNQRNGQRIFIKSIQLSLDVKASSAAPAQTVQVALVRFKQNNGVVLNGPDAWARTYAAISPLALRNIQYITQVEVLRKWVIDLNAIGESGSERLVKFYKKLNIPVYFNSGVAATAADIDKNAYALIFRGDEDPGDTAASCVGYSRIRFTD